MGLRNDILDLSIPNICEDCGQEYECGIMNWANHQEVCPKNAPNESISYHKAKVERDIRHKAEQRRVDLLYQKMNDEELNKFMLYSYSGMICDGGKLVLMGSLAMSRYNKFKDEMFEKYNIK